jgi:hypothetical protein
MTTGNQRKSASTNPKPPPCPKCGQPLTTVRYTEYGTKIWTVGQWQERDTGDAEWHAGCCDAELDYDDLQQLGVF